MGPIFLACLLAVPAGAEPFLLDVEGLRLGMSEQFAAAGLFRRASEGLSPAEVRAKVDRALAGAVPSDFVDASFAGARVLPGIEDRFRRAPERNGTYESYRRYFMTEERIAAGARFFAEKRELLEAAERRYGVDGALLASFVGIETFYGRHAGTFGVFNALYTITMKVTSRSDWAARELAEFLKACRSNGLDAHGVLGSYAGAFGFAQFIPSSFNAYAVDFDGDGRRRHDEWPDVLGSVAHYEARHNYEPGGSFDRGSRNWWAIYAYNHSEYYVRVVIELRAAILARQPAS